MSALPFDSATYAIELEAKANRLRELLAPFDAPEPQVFDSPLKHFRLRAEFRLWREGASVTTPCLRQMTSARRS